MAKIIWYFFALIMLLWEGSQNGNLLSCNRPYQAPKKTTPDSIMLKPLVDHSPYTKVSFTKEVLKGAAIVERTNRYGSIGEDKKLAGIYIHSNLYIKEIKSFLANPAYSTDQKIIVICLIQNLRLDTYLDILNYTAVLYKNQKVEEMVLEWAIAPNINKRQIIARSYKDPKVRQLLNQIRQINGLSSTTRRIIQQILTGEETKFL